MTAEELNTMVEMAKAGKCAAEIAEALHYTVSNIYKKCAKMGINLKKRDQHKITWRLTDRKTGEITVCNTAKFVEMTGCSRRYAYTAGERGKCKTHWIERVE